ncbi:LysR family transcriptional regulator [Martelella sp. HB161492]|uniref:LysR family transcriptional regulator n=1 Tax=Martelella sp. HB161492 TaxID=2720726 RepID=UPI001590B21E|nr:LysR family transcriptional regulator [Martelella sp. HB161492]
MADASWDDLQLFFEVAETGGLSGASQRTGQSAPTIGRKMLALERTLGRSLFFRSQRGYRLAHDGEILFERVKIMRAAANGIADWHKDAFALPIVAVSIETWISGLLTDHVGQIRSAEDPFRICCNSVRQGLDLTFRGADVAVLFSAPESGNLAVRRSVSMAYAVYRARAESGNNDLPWISLGTSIAETAADRYVFENHEPGIMIWTEDRHLVPRLIEQGAGRSILPVHEGDRNEKLVRESDVIETLTHPLFIVAHDDDRHRPEIRLVIERLATLLKALEPRLTGAKRAS